MRSLVTRTAEIEALGVAWLVVICIACGSSPSDDPDPRGDAGVRTDGAPRERDAEVGRPDGAMVDGAFDEPVRVRGGSCEEDSDCDDGVDCTRDTCNVECWPGESCGGRCVHHADPTACGPIETCHEIRGCEPGEACATWRSCDTSDPCVMSATCHAERRVCVVQVLDGDGDGEPPLICGGRDCDDDDTAVRPGAPEQCDGRDNDCDGRVDEGADAACDDGGRCVSGACVCRDASLTRCRGWDGEVCADVRSDDRHCGGCDRACPVGARCTSGTCRCADPSVTLCPDSFACADLQTDPFHCGACGRRCGFNQQCEGGECEACGATGEACCDGGCRDPHTACVDGRCRLRECARAVRPLPSDLLPRCTAATGACIDGCGTTDCVWSCAGADATPPASGANCETCLYHQVIACAGVAGCDAQWANWLCCTEDRCPAGSDPGCEAAQCGAAATAFGRCREAAGCYINTGLSRTCAPEA